MTNVLHSHTNLLNLPATGVFSKLVYKPPAIDSLQNLPLIVIPAGGEVSVTWSSAHSMWSPSSSGAQLKTTKHFTCEAKSLNEPAITIFWLLWPGGAMYPIQLWLGGLKLGSWLKQKYLKSILKVKKLLLQHVFLALSQYFLNHVWFKYLIKLLRLRKK